MLKPLPLVRSLYNCVVFLPVSSSVCSVPSTEEVLGHCLWIKWFPKLSLRGALDWPWSTDRIWISREVGECSRLEVV